MSETNHRFAALFRRIVSATPFIVVASLFCIASSGAATPNPSPTPVAPAGNGLIIGADVSALPVHEKAGTVYRYENNRRGDALAILRDAGMNCYRLRLFVNPDSGGNTGNDLAYTIKLAKRVKASGAKLMLDIHYSDTWADPSKQTKPRTWKDLKFDDLVLQFLSSLRL